MHTLRLTSDSDSQTAPRDRVRPLTNRPSRPVRVARARVMAREGGLPESAQQVLDTIDSMSRRIDDLARQLNCLGFFDDDDDRPRAA